MRMPATVSILSNSVLRLVPVEYSAIANCRISSPMFLVCSHVLQKRDSLTDVFLTQIQGI
jgi:hypothetical protein